MSQKHTVRQGECLVQIARRYGFPDYETIYKHPDNAELRKKRPNPSVLRPGDVVVIPDKKPKELSISTGQVHNVVVKFPKRYLNLVLLKPDGSPNANAKYTLELEGEQRKGTADGNGALSEKIPIHIATATLETDDAIWELELGALDPLREVPEDDVSGVQARLRNLGYSVPLDGRMSTATRSAIRAFQVHEGMKPTGILDDKTLDKLEEKHGS